MALASRIQPTAVIPYGAALPRVAPPTPARSQLTEFRELAATLGITLYPWQETAARYLTALGTGVRWLYPEVAIIAARQNGKTELLKVLIVGRLLAGQKIMHTAQDRQGIVRKVFEWVAEYMWNHHSDLFPERNGRPIKPRYANGQEEVQLANGAVYSIVAPSRGGARGLPRDLVIVDELREMTDDDFIGAAKPTLVRSPSPQMVYLSNAGNEQSVVLNAIKARAGGDSALAYLEWSADPERATDDEAGWLQANPTIGHDPDMIGWLRGEYRTKALEGNLQIFNTEHLCRWTPTDLPGLLSQTVFDGLRHGDVGAAVRPALAVSLDPSGTRASIAIAWRDDTGMAVRIIGDVTGNPIDAEELGRAVQKQATRLGVSASGHDPETDALLAKYLRKPESIVGAKFIAACSTFVRLAESRQLRWEGPDSMSEDIRWTARLTDPQDGTFRAIKAKDDRPITTVLAAIRAVSLASGPRLPGPRVM